MYAAMVRTRPLAAAVTAAALSVIVEPATARADTEACTRAAESAQVSLSDRKLVDAHAQLLRCASDVCPRVVRTDCLRWLDEVNASMPTIVVRVRDARDKDVLDPTITVDGHTIALSGKAINVDPGRHVIGARRGDERGTEEILVAEGEKLRLLPVQILDRRSATATEPDGAGRAPATTATSTSNPTSTSTTDGPGALPWVLVGVGAAGLATFGVLQIAASARYDELEGSCGSRCDPDEVSGGKNMVIGSAIALGIGVVSLATGVGLLWLAPKNGARAHASIGGLRATF